MIIEVLFLLEDQSGFRKGHSCIGKFFVLNQITRIGKRGEFNMETHSGFVDLEKAFER
jgi:hypothetical protein